MYSPPRPIPARCRVFVKSGHGRPSCVNLDPAKTAAGRKIARRRDEPDSILWDSGQSVRSWSLTCPNNSRDPPSRRLLSCFFVEIPPCWPPNLPQRSELLSLLSAQSYESSMCTSFLGPVSEAARYTSSWSHIQALTKFLTA